MPTRPGFDLVSVRKTTKDRLAGLKGDGSFDELLIRLLEDAPITPPMPSKPRHPDEQVALARLAATRWQLAVESGRIVELGPRLFTCRLIEPIRGELSVTWPARRGFPP